MRRKLQADGFNHTNGAKLENPVTTLAESKKSGSPFKADNHFQVLLRTSSATHHSFAPEATQRPANTQGALRKDRTVAENATRLMPRSKRMKAQKLKEHRSIKAAPGKDLNIQADAQAPQ
jgi:hypothetical protein